MKIEQNPAAGAQGAANQKRKTAKGLKSSSENQQDVSSKTDAYTLDIKSQTTTAESSITSESQATSSAYGLKEAMLKNPTLSYNSLAFDNTRVSALLGAIASDQAA
ncbi:hypothetical protein [Candidatus Magnetomonas plexicatena]|uniref:hypothetical protein n=1 Tax=Candidatus Magnetomonas plexicatena TaxID=2552947 RepID=UPI0011048088|nr:hypothetical protein E2O03_007615 [Nitrospirales bacterium LBB_01]